MPSNIRVAENNKILDRKMFLSNRTAGSENFRFPITDVR